MFIQQRITHIGDQFTDISPLYKFLLNRKVPGRLRKRRGPSAAVCVVGRREPSLAVVSRHGKLNVQMKVHVVILALSNLTVQDT